MDILLLAQSLHRAGGRKDIHVLWDFNSRQVGSRLRTWLKQSRRQPRIITIFGYESTKPEQPCLSDSGDHTAVIPVERTIAPPLSATQKRDLRTAFRAALAHYPELVPYCFLIERGDVLAIYLKLNSDPRFNATQREEIFGSLLKQL